MKTLVNESVEHIIFGCGVVVSEESGKITVEFKSNNSNKVFQFPDAFGRYLKFTDKSLEDEALKLAQAKKQLEDEEAEKIRLERERVEEERKQEKVKAKKPRKAPANKPRKAPVKKTIKVSKNTEEAVSES